MAQYSSLSTDRSSIPFFVTGGTLSRDALSYVVRQADDDLYEGLRQGSFCYVLTSRQMGKSSLMVRTASRLREAGTGVVLLDLTAIGQNLTAEQWYGGLLTQAGQQLDLEDELEEFWESHSQLGALQRWMQAIRQVLLMKYPGPVVIFIDEIDAVRGLPFSTDEFFAAIRELYNRRTEDDELQRLTFCLLGVAAPSDLIRDTRTTPFNVGHRIELHDFTAKEAAPLAAGLRGSGVALLDRVLYWTNGHPYLTQRLCQAVAEESREATSDEVDRSCRELYLTPQAQERDDNLLFVRERLLRSEADLAGLLTLYAEVLARKRVPDDVTSPLVSALRLSGVTRAKDGLLRARNRIYERVFSREWVKENMPDAELRRQREAYRRGLLRAAGIAALIIAATGSLALIAMRQRDRAEREEQRNRWLLYSAQMNLAGRDWQDSNITHMRDLLAQQVPRAGQTDLRGFEWYLLWALAHPDRQTLPLSSAISSVVFSPDLKMYATGEEGDVKLWDLASGKQVRSLKEGGLQGVIEFSPDGKLLAADSADHSIRLWDIAEGRELRRLAGHTQPIHTLIISRDGKTLASGSEDQTARLWDLVTGRQLSTLEGHTNTVNSFAFSPDGQRVATGGQDETVRVWDAATGRQLMMLKEHPAKGLSNPASIWRVAFSPDGQRIVATGNFVKVAIWDAATGQALPALEGHRSWISAFAFSPDGKFLATGSADRTILLWEAGSWRPLKRMTGHSHDFYELAFSSDSKRLASASADETIKLWDVEANPNPIVRWDVAFVTISPDGRQLASTRGDSLKLWETDNWSVIATHRVDSAKVLSMVYSPDSRILALGSEDQTARLWDVAAGREIFRLTGHTGKVWSVAFSPDGKLLATGCEDQATRLWDVMTGQQVARLEGGGADVRGVAFSPDGRLLASTSGDERVRLWEVAARRELTVLKGHTAAARAVVFSPNGKLLATTSTDSTIKLWDVATRRELVTFKGHAGGASAIAFSPDGQRLASGGGDFTMRLWDVTTGQELTALRRESNYIWSLAFTPDGRALISGTGFNGQLLVWRAATEQEVEMRRR